MKLDDGKKEIKKIDLFIVQEDLDDDHGIIDGFP